MRDTPLAASDVAAAAWTKGSAAEAKDALKRNKYRHTGTGASRSVPLRRDAYGRVGPEALTLLNKIAEYEADQICHQTAFHGDLNAGPVYHPVPGGCQARHSLDAIAGTDGRQGSPSRTACANRWPLMMCV